MNADPGRDGPNETVMYLADNATSAAAFGWRNSPTEGYPRPSPWIASDHTDGAWDEILEPREFFGGPNIVAFGGMSGGPHGYFVAGTWTTSPGHSGVSVWRSTDGRTWIHDTAEPDLQGDSVRFSFGEGVADGVRGVMLLGNVEVPTRADPGAQAGVMWFSPDGGHWTRLSDIGSPQRTYDAAWATDAGWVIAGTVGSSQARRPAEWFVPADRRVTAPVLLPGDLSAGPVRITSISGDRRTLVIAGHAGSRPLLWAARLSNGVPRSWRVLAPPPRSPVGLDRVTVSCGPDGTIISLTGNAYSQVWTTTWH